jgi:cytosolic carboxypeptidase protein 2/3
MLKREQKQLVYVIGRQHPG